jgi:hypothetical protein
MALPDGNSLPGSARAMPEGLPAVSFARNALVNAHC